MPEAAPVSDVTLIRRDLSRTASQTSPCATPRASGRAACVSAFRRRSSPCEMCGAAPKCADRRDQRPCSTQETGMVSAEESRNQRARLTAYLCYTLTLASV